MHIRIGLTSLHFKFATNSSVGIEIIDYHLFRWLHGSEPQRSFANGTAPSEYFQECYNYTEIPENGYTEMKCDDIYSSIDKKYTMVISTSQVNMPPNEVS